ncbi:MAG: sugar ABC transporter substrate-binding protein [bacterium]|nr:sugar ABC transporter substrate-binding protein [bacterium]
MSQMIKRAKLAVLLSLAAAMICGGCGDKNEGKTVIRFMRFSSPELNPVYDKIVADFEKKHPGVKIRQEETSNQVQLQTQMAGNAAPDVIAIANKSLADLGTRGTLLDLRPYIKRDGYDTGDFYSQAFDEGSVPSGAIYGMPTTGGPEILYYNKELFDKAGLAYPDAGWTWEDFLKAAKALTKGGTGNGRISQYGTSNSASGWTGSLSWLWGAGADLMNDDLSKCVVNSPGSIAAMQFLVDLEKRYKVAPGTIAATEMGGDREIFMLGRLGMFIYLPWNCLNQFAACKNLKWDMAPVPNGPQGRYPRYTGESYTIWSGSKQKELAWELVKIMSGKEVSAMLAERNWMPARKSVAASTHFVKADTPWHEEAYLESMKYARAVPSIPYLGGGGGKLAGIWNTEMVKALLGEQPVAKALSSIENQLNKVLAEERARYAKNGR